MTWRRKEDVAGAWYGYVPAVDATDGVGERRGWSECAEDSGEAGGSVRFGVEAEKAWCAGSGVDTPSALASLASRCGGMGDLGPGHAGCEGVCESVEERGVPDDIAVLVVGGR